MPSNDADAQGWDWFDPHPGAFDDASVEADESTLATLADECFSTPAGARVLRHLRLITLGRALPPTASDGILRHLEGQRFLVHYLLSLVRRARDGSRYAP